MQRFKKYISLKKYRDWLPYKKQIQKNIFFVHSIKMLKLALNELNQIAKMEELRAIKVCLKKD